MACHFVALTASYASVQGHMQTLSPKAFGDPYSARSLVFILIILKSVFYRFLDLPCSLPSYLIHGKQQLHLRFHGNFSCMKLVPEGIGKVGSVQGIQHHRHIHHLTQLSKILRNVCGCSHIGMAGFGIHPDSLPL